MIMMLGQEKCTSMSKSKRSRLVWTLTRLDCPTYVFEIAAKANDLGQGHGTMMLPAQLGGIHFTDACASSCPMKMKWYSVERILKTSDSSGTRQVCQEM